jgi:hypothetical protein
MTGLTQIHQCPRCVLRFTSKSELDYHLSNDHTPRPRIEQGAASVASTAVSPAIAVTPTVADPEPARIAARRRSAWSVAWIFGAVGALAVVVAAVASSTSTTLIVLGLAVALVGSYGWIEHVRRWHAGAGRRDIP